MKVRRRSPPPLPLAVAATYTLTCPCPPPPQRSPGMPAVRGVQHGLICDCCAPTAGAESLAEVAFAKSAAAAAQSGDFFRLKSLITRNPAAVHDDGYGGARACGGERGTEGSRRWLWALARSACRTLGLHPQGGCQRTPCSTCLAPCSTLHTPAPVTGSSGYTPVIYAARQGHVDCVELLLACGAAPDAATAAGGATALQRAAYMGHLRVVQLLLDAGATAALQDGDGQARGGLLGGAGAPLAFPLWQSACTLPVFAPCRPRCAQRGSRYTSHAGGPSPVRTAASDCTPTVAPVFPSPPRCSIPRHVTRRPRCTRRRSGATPTWQQRLWRRRHSWRGCGTSGGAPPQT